jgi:predicted nucleic acid-binding protein
VARLVVDTGFLVALYLRADSLYDPAIRFLRESRAPLITASPVIVEACHFLNTRGKVELLKWIEKGGLNVAEVPAEAYPALAAQLEKYADLEIDLADAALIWLAELVAEYRILTVDERDFSSFRLKGRKRFELLRWYRLK